MDTRRGAIEIHLPALRSADHPAEFPVWPRRLGWQERAGQAGAGLAGRSEQGWQKRAGLAGAGRAGASLSACCPLESAAPQCTAAQGQPESSSPSIPRQALHPPRSSRACHPGEFLPRERKSLLRREPWAPSSNGLPRRWDLPPRRFPKMWQTEARRLEPGCCVRAPPPAKQHWPGLRGLGGVCLAMYVALLAARRSERLQKLACFGSIPRSPKCFRQGQQKAIAPLRVDGHCLCAVHHHWPRVSNAQGCVCLSGCCSAAERTLSNNLSTQCPAR